MSTCKICFIFVSYICRSTFIFITWFLYVHSVFIYRHAYSFWSKMKLLSNIIFDTRFSRLKFSQQMYSLIVFDGHHLLCQKCSTFQYILLPPFSLSVKKFRCSVSSHFTLYFCYAHMSLIFNQTGVINILPSLRLPLAFGSYVYKITFFKLTKNIKRSKPTRLQQFHHNSSPATDDCGAFHGSRFCHQMPTMW